ncbi:hypothetical protein [Cutibacterium avidum]|uniref:Phage tail protein n=1 Tax=Cutibacterium avidum TaxID=33010 RepID=A0A3E2DMJ2_9ACTN|nr:hypothetical protein [Cutibacterium avidum]RFT46514.1 hypothetical protein CHT91_02940 [Cutibacterium avidum]TMT54746.1 hypothetical protein DMY01_03000 [Cutibacterium avidum]
MADRNASNVRIAVAGDVYVGDPHAGDSITSISTVPSGMTALGYLSEDGVEIKPDRKSDAITAWQNSDIVRTTSSESSLEVSFTMIESTKQAIELYWQTTVTGGKEAGSFDVSPGKSSGVRSLLVDFVDGKEVVRYYFPEVELTEREEIKGQNGELLGYGVTLSAHPAKIGDTGDYLSARGWMTALKDNASPAPGPVSPKPGSSGSGDSEA